MANGWGQGTWGAVGWGGIGNISFSVTGVAGTTAVGSESVTASALVVETGLQATGAVGTVTASSVHVTTPTGVVGTTTVGNVLPKIPQTVAVTGLQGTTGFLSGWGSPAWDEGVWGGGVFADHGQTLPITGLQATGQSNNPTITASGVFGVTGVAGTTGIGDALAGAGARVVETGLSGTVNIGNEAVVGTALISPTGVSSTLLISGYEASTVTKVVTVQSVSSANKYFIDGVQQQTQELFEGNTYYFDQSDSSNSGHPLRFSTTSNGSHGGGSEYTTGVTTSGTPGSSGAYTQITVADKAPTLYYYCTQHSAMGGTANTPAVYTILTSTGAPVTNVVGTTALGSESVTASSNTAVTLAGLSISIGTLAISGGSVLSLTGVTGTGLVGPEQVYSLIKPDQLANWIERVA